MKPFKYILKRLFNKRHSYVMNKEDLKIFISSNNLELICDNCHKVLTIEDIAKIYFKDKQLKIYCNSCEE